MNQRIEFVHFSTYLILLVTHMALTNSKLRRMHNYSLPTDQPRLVVADVLLHTSQLSLAIPSYVGAVGTINDNSVVTA